MYYIVYNETDKHVRVCVEAPDEVKVKDVDESILSFETKEEAKAFISENINEKYINPESVFKIPEDIFKIPEDIIEDDEELEVEIILEGEEELFEEPDEIL